MNQFHNTESTGLLKDTYGDSGVADALKRKREKLALTKLGLEPKEKSEEDNEQDATD